MKKRLLNKISDLKAAFFVACLLAGSNWATLSAQTILYSETFNASLGTAVASNSVSGDWIFTNSCARSSMAGHTAPGSALFSGSGCQFGNGGNTVSGNLTTPSISIPAGATATLSFNYSLQNECGTSGTQCGYDVIRVQISNDAGATFTTVLSSNNTPGGLVNGSGWVSASYNLSAFSGQNILVRFNFNSGDGFGNAYDGVYVDDITVEAIVPAAALHFDGSNDRVSVPNNASLNFGTGDFTVESYFKSAVGNPNYAGVVVKANNGGNIGFQLVVVNNRIAAEFASSSVALGVGNGLIGTTVITDGNWHHLAMVVNRAQNKIELLVDGNIEATVVNANISTMNVNTTANMLMGVERTFIAHLNGAIDEVRLWNVARTQCQINTFKNCEIPTTATGLVANYHFNQGIAGTANSTVTSLADVSGNANNGTLTNFALTGTVSNWVFPGAVVSGSITPASLTPTVTANATNTVICNGQSTTLNGGGASTYTWTGGVINGVAFSPSVTTTYTVIGTAAASGCTNSAVRTITVNPLPAVTANASSTVICNGQTVTLTGGGASTYTWTGGVTNGVAFAPSSTQSYTVTGTSAAGCTNTAVRTITVNAVPSISVNSGVICSGQSFTIVPSGASTYTYSGGSAVVSPSATTAYSVTGTNAAGCTSTVAAVSNVTVNALPLVSANVSNPVICEGASTTLSGSGANTYSWTGGVVNGVAFSPMSSASYTVTGTNTVTGCSNNAVGSVTVNPLPVVSASTTNSAICEGSSTTLNGGGADTYTWTGGVSNGVAFTPSATASYTVTGTNTLTGCTSTNIAVQTITVNANPTVTAASGAICSGGSYTISPSGASVYTISGGSNVVTPSTTTSYTVTGASAEGCTGTAVVTVSVQSSLTVSISGPNAICEGQTANLTANGAATYSWSTGATGNSIATTPTVTTTYSVSGASGTCSDVATVTVVVNQNPTVSIASSSSVICAGSSVTLTASGASTYTWNNAATGSSISDSPTVTVTYTVTGENSNGCTSMATLQQSVSACTGINELSAASVINVYPNPGYGLATIELSVDATVAVINILGDVISNETLTAGSHTIDIRNFANGVYFVKVLQKGNQQTVKLIKQ